jgi:hypothetical protein
MWLLGRPSPTRGHARPGRDHRDLGATHLAVVPSSPLATPGIWGVISGIGTWAAPLQLGGGAHAQRRCVLTGEAPCSWCPVPADHGPGVGPCPWGGLASIIQEKGWGWRVGTTASCVAPGRTVSSQTGLCPRRGRPPTQPHYSVVHPTQLPPQGNRVEATGEHPRSPDHEASARRPGPGTARPPAGNRPDRPVGSTRSRPTALRPSWRPGRWRARSELSGVHGCSHDHEHP